MIKNILLVTVFAGILSVSAFAQGEGRFEIGVTGGVGAYAVEELADLGTLDNVGIEVCAFCSGRFGLFGKYDHWLSSGGPQTNKADVAGFGVRFQSRSQRVRPFFDLGMAFAKASYSRTLCCSGSRYVDVNSTPRQIIVGGGVMIPIKQHFYIRPQVRALAGVHLAATAQVGFGWRF